MSHHLVIVLGNLGVDPEMRYTPSGQAVTSFSVCANRQYKGTNGETVKETVWFRVSAWGKVAESCKEYLKKGSLVYIEARLTPDKATGSPKIWTKQDGTSGASYEVNVNTIRFLSKYGEVTSESHQTEEPDSEELPF